MSTSVINASPECARISFEKPQLSLCQLNDRLFADVLNFLRIITKTPTLGHFSFATRQRYKRKKALNVSPDTRLELSSTSMPIHSYFLRVNFPKVADLITRSYERNPTMIQLVSGLIKSKLRKEEPSIQYRPQATGTGKFKIQVERGIFYLERHRFGKHIDDIITRLSKMEPKIRIISLS